MAVLARFLNYAQKAFGLSGLLTQLVEPRQAPEIPLRAIFGAAFLTCALRIGSLNGFEPSLKDRTRFHELLGPRRPSGDSIGRVYALMDPDPQRKILASIAHQLKRKKVFDKPEQWPLRFAAIDGHEFFSSRSRCCDQCQTRTLTINGEEVIEYYHRGVVMSLVGYEIDLPLDVEMCAKGEGELTAAKRLVERVCRNYPRFFDVIIGDEEYATEPFFTLCRRLGKDVAAVVRGKHRVLVQDADAVFAAMEPTSRWTIPAETPATRRKETRTIRCWDVEGFNTFEGFADPVRVMKTEETILTRRQTGGEMQDVEEHQTWGWVTTVSQAKCPSRLLHRGGHGRWSIENNIFHTLCTHWHMDHCYRHAPQAIVNFILTLFIAFVLAGAFFTRNLKPSPGHPTTLKGLSAEFWTSVGERIGWSFVCRPP